ncbi:DUF2637 domain-containing protein (plasmid) [Streptomyces althioticus]|uniref:DUF2637 domain-containing protein n=1 Tax=Streptomyces althioticus TaxID=83380 RepID=A0ABZ1YFF5_9ACTN
MSTATHAPPLTKRAWPRTKSRPAPWRVRQLTRTEKCAVVFSVLAFIGAGVAGFWSSFDGVRTWAAQRAAFEYAALVPLAIDLLIPASGVLAMILIRLDMELRWLRYAPWALTAATVYLNASSVPDIPGDGVTGPPLSAQVAHGLMAGIWAMCSEVGIHVYKAHSKIESGQRMARIRRSRWLLSPVRTALLWRRMVLWEIRGYDVALQLEHQRLLEVARLKREYARLRWRWRAPLEERVRLTLGVAAPVPTAAHSDPTPVAESIPSSRTEASPSDSSRSVGLTPALREPDESAGSDAGQSVGPTPASRESDRSDASTEAGYLVGRIGQSGSLEPTDWTHAVESGALFQPTPTPAGPTADPTAQVSDSSVGPDPSPSDTTTDPTDTDETTTESDQEPKDEPTGPTPRRATRSLPELLDDARTKLSGVPTSELTEERIRRVMACGASRARYVRDQLKQERAAKPSEPDRGTG